MKRLQYASYLSAGVLACMLSGVSAPASAQDSTIEKSAPLPQSPPPPPPAPAATPAPLVPSITAEGQTLKNNGIYLILGYGQQLSYLASGGIQKGTFTTGELDFGTVLDLQTLLGIPGASFHMTWDERNGYNINNNVGTQGPLMSNSGPTRTIRLSELFWEQAFDHDRIDIRIGRTNPTNDFAVSDISCQFVSSVICAQPGSWYFSNANGGYPVSSWGGFINYQFTPQVYFRTGIYDNQSDNSGPNSLNWNVSQSVGQFIPMELGYLTNFANARYPAKYDVGGYWDDSNYTTPGGVNLRGRTAFYVQGQQAIWRPDPATHQSFTPFGGAIIYTGGAPYWSQVYGGFLDRAPFVTRQNDTVAFIASYYANASNQRPNKSSQWIFELNYGFTVVPGFTLTPFTQYVIAPNDFQAPVGSKRPDNAWVVGLQATVDFAALFGFPVWQPY